MQAEEKKSACWIDCCHGLCIRSSFLSTPPFLSLPPSLSPVSPGSGVSALAFPLSLGFFSSRGPFSFVLFVRSSTRASKHFGERNPGVSSIILRARLFPRARVEAELVAVPRVGSVRDLLWESGEDRACEVSLGEVMVGGDELRGIKRWEVNW